MVDGLRPYYEPFKKYWAASGDLLTASKFLKLIQLIQPEFTLAELKKVWGSSDLEEFISEDQYLTRKQVSVILDQVLDTFEIQVDWRGWVTQRQSQISKLELR
jgi:hypothetical protein